MDTDAIEQELESRLDRRRRGPNELARDGREFDDLERAPVSTGQMLQIQEPEADEPELEELAAGRFPQRADFNIQEHEADEPELEELVSSDSPRRTELNIDEPEADEPGLALLIRSKEY